MISAGVASPYVSGVIAMSTQSYGTREVYKLSPKPLLLLHGTTDEILPSFCSEDIYERAEEPKQLILYAGCRHGLDQCIPQLEEDLEKWIAKQLQK